jgi:hypothetical protein
MTFQEHGKAFTITKKMYSQEHIRHTLNLYRSYFKGVRADIQLQVYSVTCWPYASEVYRLSPVLDDAQIS